MFFRTTMKRKNSMFRTYLYTIIFWFFTYNIFSSKSAQKLSTNLFGCGDVECKELYTKEHELTRRRLDNTIRELYHFFTDQVERYGGNPEFQNFGKFAINKTISLIAQSASLSTSVNKAGDWHRSELKKISNFIFQRIDQLQHPKNCKDVKILICELGLIRCGLGCLTHRIAYCLNVAAASNRTMILHNDGVGWQYSRKRGWDVAFKPVSSCTYENVVGNKKKSFVNWYSASQKDKITFLKIYEISTTMKVKDSNGKKVEVHFFERPKQVPLSFPASMEDSLLTHHSNPPVFFGAHFIWYVSQNNQKVQNMLDEAISSMKLKKSPVVGIYIRRGDKLDVEADFHPLEKYFKYAELWFQVQERQNPRKKLKRRVYIASDELSAIEEARRKYPQYEILYDINSVNTTGTNVYSEDFLRRVIINQQILSECDHLICTFSSNACRYIHEIMQVKNGDADNQGQSIDTAYRDHFSWFDRNFVVVEDHAAAPDSEELNLKIGNIIGVEKFQGNLFNGYSTGFMRDPPQTIKRKTKLVGDRESTWYNMRYVLNEGRYPSYKAQEVWNIVDFPMFNP